MKTQIINNFEGNSPGLIIDGEPYSAKQAEKERMEIMDEEKPRCELIGTDGNVFALMGRVSRVLKKSGQLEKVKEMQSRVMECGSYDEALQVFMEYVEVE